MTATDRKLELWLIWKERYRIQFFILSGRTYSFPADVLYFPGRFGGFSRQDLEADFALTLANHLSALTPVTQ